MNVAHLVRAHDPLSSVMAAERTPQFAGGHCARILADLTRRLPDLQKAGKARVVQRGGVELMRAGARVWEAV